MTWGGGNKSCLSSPVATLPDETFAPYLFQMRLGLGQRGGVDKGGNIVISFFGFALRGGGWISRGGSRQDGKMEHQRT